MSKAAEVNVLYPRKEGSTFDTDYYVSKHIPLVWKHWSSFGLKSWSVTQFGPDSPYLVGCHMVWESTDAVQTALQQPGTKEIMGDIENFTSEKPILAVGQVLASS